MGLDITAYDVATHVPGHATDEDDEGWGLVQAFAYPDFRRALDGMAGQDDDIVFGTTTFAGGEWFDVSDASYLEVHWSYGGYNNFRNAIACAALGVDAGEVWAHKERYESRPFFDLINFADNEGVIGPVASRRLADAFLANPNLLIGSDHHQRYLDASAAFVLAADTGLVQFG